MRRIEFAVALIGLMLTSMVPVSRAASTTLVIERFVYDGSQGSTEGDEYVKICNVSTGLVSLDGYKVGDEETSSADGGGTESMYSLPNVSLDSAECIIIAKRADQFNAHYGLTPDYEFAVGNDTGSVPNLNKHTTWATGSWGLANDGDEIILLDSGDNLVDGICYEGGVSSTTSVGTIVTDSCSNLSAGNGEGLKRTDSTDTDKTTDFGVILPNAVTLEVFSATAAMFPSPWSILLPIFGLLAFGSILVFRRRPS